MPVKAQRYLYLQCGVVVLSVCYSLLCDLMKVQSDENKTETDITISL